MKHLLLLALLWSGSFAAQRQFDQSHLDEDMVTFNAQLHLAAAQKDTALLGPLLAETLRMGYDAYFEDKSELLIHLANHPEDELWKELLHSTRMGWLRESGGEHAVFVGPAYAAAGETEGQVLVVGEGVRLRSTPGYQSNVLDVVSFAFLDCAGAPWDANVIKKDGAWWVEVFWNDEPAYLHMNYTSLAFGRQLEVQRTSEGFKLSAAYFLAGC